LLVAIQQVFLLSNVGMVDVDHLLFRCSIAYLSSSGHNSRSISEVVRNRADGARRSRGEKSKWKK